MSAVLGIDLGLSSARAAIMDHRGRLIGRGRVAFPANASDGPGPEHAPDQWRKAVVAAVRQALAGVGRAKIDAIGIGAFGPCPILLDKDHRPIMAATMFAIDTRSEAQRRRLISRHGIKADRLGPDNTIPQLLWWRRQRPADFARASVVVDVAGYLVNWLVGRPVIDSITLNDHHCQGLPQPVPLPEVLPAAAIAGGLLASIAAELGLPSGTPVTVGTYDSHVDLAANGVVRRGQAGILLGSTVVLGAIVGRRFAPAKAARQGLRITPHIGRGLLLGGWTSSSGSLIDWASESFGRQSQASSAQAMPGAAGLILLPYLAGERAPIWDPLARGAIVGITRSTTGGELARAAIEGVALSIFDISQRLYRTIGKPKSFRASGGGVRDPAWAQATVDALDTPLETIEHAGEGIGPAMLAMRAIGNNLEPRISKVLVPNERSTDRYRQLYRIYRRMYPALRMSMHELARLQEQEKKIA